MLSEEFHPAQDRSKLPLETTQARYFEELTPIRGPASIVDSFRYVLVSGRLMMLQVATM